MWEDFSRVGLIVVVCIMFSLLCVLSGAWLMAYSQNINLPLTGDGLIQALFIMGGFIANTKMIQWQIARTRRAQIEAEVLNDVLARLKFLKGLVPMLDELVLAVKTLDQQLLKGVHDIRTRKAMASTFVVNVPDFTILSELTEVITETRRMVSIRQSAQFANAMHQLRQLKVIKAGTTEMDEHTADRAHHDLQLATAPLIRVRDDFAAQRDAMALKWDQRDVDDSV